MPKACSQNKTPSSVSATFCCFWAACIRLCVRFARYICVPIKNEGEWREDKGRKAGRHLTDDGQGEELTPPLMMPSIVRGKHPTATAAECCCCGSRRCCYAAAAVAEACHHEPTRIVRALIGIDHGR